MQDRFERWGKLVAGHPILVLVIAVVILSAGIAGLARLSAANDVEQFFVSGSESYRRYDAMQALFPSSQLDAILVVSDPDLMTPERLEALRDLHLDLSLEDGVTGVVSLFSMQQPDPENGSLRSIVPYDVPRGEAFDRLVADISAHPLVRNRLLSADRSTLLINVGLDPARTDGDSLRQSVTALRRIAGDRLGGVGLTAILTGAPVMRVDLDAINAREQLRLALAGLLVGGLVSLAYFRRFSFVLISGTVPVTTVVLSYGLLGWIGMPITLALQIVAPLLTFIAFNNAMHVLFAIRRQFEAGASPAPIPRAIAEIGPASLMTSLTSAIAFGALMLAGSEAIQAFGALAAFGTMLSFFAVITIVPALVSLVIRLRGADFMAHRRSGGSRIAAACVAADRAAGRHSGAIVAASVILFIGFALAQLSLTPRYILSDNMPFGAESRTAISTVDGAFGGSQPLRIILRWPAHETAAEAAVLNRLRDIGARLSAHPAVGPVLSLASFGDWLADARPQSAASLDALLDALPITLAPVLIDRAAGAALVTAMIPDQPTQANLDLIATIEADLADIGLAAPGFHFEITGLVALTAIETGRIMTSLQIGLLAAVVVIVGLIGVTFRHPWPAAISILPNLFPIAVGGAFLALRGGELNFAGAIAMTVAFGLAVDDTIHMLYRFRADRAQTGDVDQALARTIGKIAPVLVVSSLVLIAGIAVLFLSEMPMNRDYGTLTIIIILAALIGDLILLPALIRQFHGRFGSTGKAGDAGGRGPASACRRPPETRRPQR